jgi:chromosome segregation ATPase
MYPSQDKMELCQKYESDLSDTRLKLEDELKESMTRLETLDAKYTTLEKEAHDKETSLNKQIQTLNEVQGYSEIMFPSIFYSFMELLYFYILFSLDKAAM